MALKVTNTIIAKLRKSGEPAINFIQIKKFSVPWNIK